MTSQTVRFKGFDNFVLRNTNDIYQPLYQDISRFLVLYGGGGSGKSVFASQKKIRRILKENNHKILVVRKVAKTLFESCYARLQSQVYQWRLEKLFTFNKSPLEIRCVNGNKIIFFGLDDVEKIKSIDGVTSIWIEEASELTYDDFKQLNIRLRGKLDNCKQIILSFNPISEKHWLKKHFFDIEQENATICHSTYKNNTFLDAEYIRELENLKNVDQQYYRIYALGEWGILKGQIYSNYKVKEIPTSDDYYDRIICGLDWGFNDPAAAVKIGIKDKDIYVLQEIYKTQLTNPELMDLVSADISKKYQYVADSSEPDRIKEFSQAGFNIKAAKKGQGSIRIGIDYIRRYRVYISPSCINYYNEICSYRYKADKDGNTLEEPVDLDNHLMDATRYALESEHTSFKPWTAQVGWV